MSDPLSYLPLAIAAANGTLDGIEARRLVASGVALLQRTAPLVRALRGRRSAILVEGGRALLVALAASEGRAALLLDPSAGATATREALAASDVGAVFTVHALAERLPSTLPRVLLDEAPVRARWEQAGEERLIDLAMHEGLHLEGEGDVPGAEEAVLVPASDDPDAAASGMPLSHLVVLASARAIGDRLGLAARDHTLTLAPCSRLFSVVTGVVAPLLAGGRVTTGHADDAARLIERLEGDGVSMLVGAPGDFAAILDETERRGRALDAPVLKHCLAGGATLDEALRARWYHHIGVALQQP